MLIEFNNAKVGKVVYDSATVKKSDNELASCEVTLHDKNKSFDISFDVLDLGDGRTDLNPKYRRSGLSTKYKYYLAKIVYHALEMAKEKKKGKTDNSNKCTSTTKKGSRCKKKALYPKDNPKYCGIHKNVKKANKANKGGDMKVETLKVPRI